MADREPHRWRRSKPMKMNEASQGIISKTMSRRSWQGCAMRTTRSVGRGDLMLRRSTELRRTCQLCSLQELLARLGAKWTVRVLTEVERASERYIRFSELRAVLDGISHRVLAATLRGLERDGLLRRNSRSSRSRGPGYALTPLGRSILAAVRDFTRRTIRLRPRITASRRAYAARRVQSTNA